MNISTGISQVIFQTRLPGKILLKKVYVWPGYNAGKINKISNIHTKENPEINYIKSGSNNPSDNTRNLKTKDSHSISSENHFLYLQNTTVPGSYFHAYA